MVGVYRKKKTMILGLRDAFTFYMLLAIVSNALYSELFEKRDLRFQLEAWTLRTVYSCSTITLRVVCELDSSRAIISAACFWTSIIQTYEHFVSHDDWS